jgi:hypothetical protein
VAGEELKASSAAPRGPSNLAVNCRGKRPSFGARLLAPGQKPRALTNKNTGVFRGSQSQICPARSYRFWSGARQRRPIERHPRGDLL